MWLALGKPVSADHDCHQAGSLRDSSREDRHPELNASQRQAVDEIFLSREKVVGLDGIAGGGKTTTLSLIREGAEAEGYRVEGFTPTSRAARNSQKQTWRHPRYKSIWPAESSQIPARSGSMFSTNPR